MPMTTPYHQLFPMFAPDAGGMQAGRDLWAALAARRERREQDAQSRKLLDMLMTPEEAPTDPLQTAEPDTRAQDALKATAKRTKGLRTALEGMGLNRNAISSMGHNDLVATMQALALTNGEEDRQRKGAFMDAQTESMRGANRRADARDADTRNFWNTFEQAGRMQATGTDPGAPTTLERKAELGHRLFPFSAAAKAGPLALESPAVARVVDQMMEPEKQPWQFDPAQDVYPMGNYSVVRVGPQSYTAIPTGKAEAVSRGDTPKLDWMTRHSITIKDAAIEANTREINKLMPNRNDPKVATQIAWLVHQNEQARREKDRLLANAGQSAGASVTPMSAPGGQPLAPIQPMDAPPRTNAAPSQPVLAGRVRVAPNGAIIVER